MFTTVHHTDTDQSCLEHPQGGPWPFALATQSAVILADTVTELIAGMIDGYDRLDDDDALVVRHRHACAIADVLSAELAHRHGLDPAQESEDTLTALFSPRAGGLAHVEGSWNHRIPLVLVRTDFEPFTDRPAPRGNVRFIDPSHERVFLESLHALKAVWFSVNRDIC